jgi:hypothetical protein
MANTSAQLAARMSRTQAKTLMDLSVEAYQPRMFRDDLSKFEAANRIQALKAEIELANSF